MGILSVNAETWDPGVYGFRGCAFTTKKALAQYLENITEPLVNLPYVITVEGEMAAIFRTMIIDLRQLGRCTTFNYRLICAMAAADDQIAIRPRDYVDINELADAIKEQLPIEYEGKNILSWHM